MRRGLLLGVWLLAVGLAACEAENDAGPTSDEAATAVTIDAGDLFFAPDTVNVSADGVAITLDNIGLVEHDLMIDAIDLAMYVDVGETVTETVVLPAGTYDFYCSIPGHQQAGMEGVIAAS